MYMLYCIPKCIMYTRHNEQAGNEIEIFKSLFNI
jgi:hypothetical protein